MKWWAVLPLVVASGTQAFTCLYLSPAQPLPWSALNYSVVQQGCAMKSDCVHSFPLVSIPPDHSVLSTIECDSPDPAPIVECSTLHSISPSLAHLFVSRLDAALSNWMSVREVWIGAQSSGASQTCAYTKTDQFPMLLRPLGVECTTPRVWLCGCTQLSTPSPTNPPTTKSPTTKSPTTSSPTSKSPTSLAPTTKSPTTSSPVSLAPVSLAPTSLAPTSANDSANSEPSGSPTLEATYAPSSTPTGSPSESYQEGTFEPTGSGGEEEENTLEPTTAVSNHSPTFLSASDGPSASPSLADPMEVTGVPTGAPTFQEIEEVEPTPEPTETSMTFLPTSSPTQACVPGQVTCCFQASNATLTGFFVGSRNYTNQLLLMDVEQYMVSFDEPRGERNLVLTLEPDFAQTVFGFELSCVCQGECEQSETAYLDVTWNTLSTSSANWTVFSLLNSEIEPHERVQGNSSCWDEHGTHDLIQMTPATPTTLRISTSVLGTCEGDNLDQATNDELDPTDESLFQALTLSMKRHLWKQCNTLGVSPCDACSSQTPETDFGVDCEDKKLVGLRFPNLGLLGELDTKTLNQFQHVKRLDFSSNPAQANPNVLNMAQGTSCVRIKACLKPGVKCNFDPLPICHDLETESAGSIIGWVILALGVIFIAFLFVFMRRKKNPGEKRLSFIPTAFFPSIKGKPYEDESSEDEDPKKKKGWTSYNPLGMLTKKIPASSYKNVNADDDLSISVLDTGDLEGTLRERRRTREFSIGQVPLGVSPFPEIEPLGKEPVPEKWDKRKSEGRFESNVNTTLGHVEHINPEY